MDEDQIRKKYGIIGCEHCPHFVEVHKPGRQWPWRQYCGKENFNINTASFVVKKTSHNKNKVIPDNHFEWNTAFPNRCPLRKETTV